MKRPRPEARQAVTASTERRPRAWLLQASSQAHRFLQAG
jgi:hypothetical protein